MINGLMKHNLKTVCIKLSEIIKNCGMYVNYSKQSLLMHVYMDVFEKRIYRMTSMLKSVVICHTSLHVLGKRLVWCYR